MTTPHDRVAYGAHVFPFAGLHSSDEGLPPRPLLPVRVRAPGGAWSRPFNAVLDTGSTWCLLQTRLARDLGFSVEGPEEEMRGAGGRFKSALATCDVGVMDAQFPEVTCLEVDAVDFAIPLDEDALDISVLGRNVLRLFDLSVSHRKGRIELRLSHGV